MIEYSLITENNHLINSFVADTYDEAIKNSLICLNVRVEPVVNDDVVREFFLVDNDSGEELDCFVSYYHENACLEALNRLGYSCLIN